MYIYIYYYAGAEGMKIAYGTIFFPCPPAYLKIAIFLGLFRLGGLKKNIESRISIAIQECIACTHRGPNFTTGKIQRKESLFNKDVFIQR